MKKTIIFLSEMPITNGVIQAQMLPVAFAARKKDYETVVIETIGRFDSQEEFREKLEKKLLGKGVKKFSVKIPQRTTLPSIIYFTFKIRQILAIYLKNQEGSSVMIYARNYKLTPLLLFFKSFWGIPFVYSPRGAYVAERKHYRKTRDLLFASCIKFLEKRAIQKSAFTIAETEEFKKHLEKIYSLPEGKISIIPNYFDTSLLPGKDFDREKIRQEMGVEKKKVITYAGTVEVWYDFEKMFDLISRLKKKDTNIFFLLFAKRDYARKESSGMMEELERIAQKYDLSKNKDFKISSYPPEKRYSYLAACDAGICLTTPEKFKTMMMYLKIVDYIGAGLPIITNRQVGFAKNFIQKTKTGALVDYENWENSIEQIDLEKLFSVSRQYPKEKEKYSSEKILPAYLEIFAKTFPK